MYWFGPTSTERLADIVMQLHQEGKNSDEHYLVRATHKQFFSHNGEWLAAFAFAFGVTVAERTHLPSLQT